MKGMFTAMIVSETKQFVFIHNPKCAGTSVRNALLKFDTTNNQFWGYMTANASKIDKAHLPMYMLRQIFPEYFKRLDTSFVFMQVRNPYLRAVSAFNETTNSEMLNTIREAQDKGPATKAYRDALNEFILKMSRKDVAGWTFEYRHWVRQYDMAYLGRKRMVDLVIKLESWPSGLDKIAVFDPELRDVLLGAGAINVRRSTLDPMESLTPASIRKINEIYRDDFLVFNYKMI